MLMGSFLAFSLTGCMTILGSRTQGVTVTARPAGARVLVDGAIEGLTPLELRQAKKPPHVIRIEKEGFRPVEIRMTAHKNWFPIIFPNLFWAGLGLPALANPDVQTDRDRLVAAAFITLGVVTPIAAIIIDAHSAKSSVIRPSHLLITLEEGDSEGPPRWSRSIARASGTSPGSAFWTRTDYRRTAFLLMAP
jgi:hypothetical protein